MTLQGSGTETSTIKANSAGNLLDYGNIEVTTATAEENDNHLIASLAHADKFRNTLTGGAV